MVTKLEPTNCDAWLDYGETLLELGYVKQALKAFDKAKESNPISSEPHYYRAKALILLRRTGEAIDSLKQCFQLNPDMQQMFEEEFPDAKSLKAFKKLLEK
jgi:tetratricopeptide (TPR) repeat protein